MMIDPVAVVYTPRTMDEDLKLRVDGNPSALMFKHRTYSPLNAVVCGRCGYTEFYASEPAKLAEAFRAGRE
jgi:predicted nucleic-acid-binding Zn-ribbon protein